MSLFKKHIPQNEEEVYIPQVVTTPAQFVAHDSNEPTQAQLMQQSLDNEASMIECVENAIPTIVNGVRDVTAFVTDCIKMHEQTEQLRLMTNVQLANITAKYEVTKEYMKQSFGERNQSLTRFYNTLDQAITNNDRELIIASMQNISNIVAESPLQDIEKFRELYNDTSKPLLDF